MAKKKAILTGDTLFPRSFKNEDHSGVSQPYVSGLYLALTIKTMMGEQFQQTGVDWSKLPKFVKEVKKNCKKEDIVMCRLADFLKQEDIDIIIS